MLYFYHCTTDIFLDSILKNGLGKINPSIDLKLLDLLEYLHEISKNNISFDSDFNELSFATELMIKQEIKLVDKKIYNTDVLNFTHDGVFLTLGERAAITHYHYTKYGSEILNRVMQIYNLLLKHNIDFEIPKNINLMNIENLLLIEPKPIFIKVKNINDKYLLNVYNIPMLGTLEGIEKKMESTPEKVNFGFKQTTVFKYIVPIDIKDIEVYYLEYEGHPIDQNFEFFLSKIK